MECLHEARARPTFGWSAVRQSSAASRYTCGVAAACALSAVADGVSFGAVSVAGAGWLSVCYCPRDCSDPESWGKVTRRYCILRMEQRKHSVHDE